METCKAPRLLKTIAYGVDGNGKTIKQLVSPYLWKDPIHGDIIVPEGFIFDGASIPEWAWSLILTNPFDEGVVQAALVHDWLYTTHEVPRAEADAIFYEILTDQEVSNHKRLIMYLAVRTFGALAWANGVTVDDKVKPLKVERLEGCSVG